MFQMGKTGRRGPSLSPSRSPLNEVGEPCCVGSCHHGMARPLVADGEGLHICRVAANMLNKRPRHPTAFGPPAWELGDRLTT